MSMAIDKTRLSTKGQIVIPKRIRDEMQIKPGDDLVVISKGNQIIIHPLTLETLISEAREAYEQGRTKTTEEVFQEL
ncbi:MAG: AbrB/MazE/SpoVT family DNA-binding domain-containing protein [Candidatus Bipolaricaulota bacterium]|nr:AbrB/MazE/SpoVT family DNA-binding domain-containing protein [Candidatus Bipolaricaulota bacterium]